MERRLTISTGTTTADDEKDEMLTLSTLSVVVVKA